MRRRPTSSSPHLSPRPAAEVEPRLLLGAIAGAGLVVLGIAGWLLLRTPEPLTAHRGPPRPAPRHAPASSPPPRPRVLPALAPSSPGSGLSLAERAADPAKASSLPGFTLQGLVVTYPDGQPLAGAMVEVRLDLPDQGHDDPAAAQQRILRSDAEGVFGAAGFKAGRYVLRGSHPRFGDSLLEWRLPAATARGPVLWLGAPGAIRGTVRDHDGRPLVAFPVTVRPLAGLLGARRVQTDPEGTYLVEGLVPGGYVVEASINWLGLVDRYPDLRASFPISPTALAGLQARDRLASSAILASHAIPVAVPVGSESVVDFAQNAGLLRGRILRPGGKPPRVSRLELLGEDVCLAGAHPRFTTVTGEDGRFVFAGVPPGAYRLRLWGGPAAMQAVDLGTVHPGPSSGDASSSGGRIDVRLGGATLRVEARTGAGEIVRGWDPRKAPQGGVVGRGGAVGSSGAVADTARAWLIREGPRSQDPEFRLGASWSEKQGVFLFRDVREGAYTVVVEWPGFGRGVAGGIRVGRQGGEIPLRITVARGEKVAVRAEGRIGHPPADWRGILLDASRRIPLGVVSGAARAPALMLGVDPGFFLFQAPLHRAGVVSFTASRTGGSEVVGHLDPLE